MNREEKERQAAARSFEQGMEDMDLERMEANEGRGDRLTVEAYTRREGRRKLLYMILAIIGVVAIGSFIYMVLGPWSFLGLVSLIIAYPFFKSKLKAEDYILWEVQIPGQKYEVPGKGNVTVKTRALRRWRITPATWDYLHIEGEPFSLGGIFLCNYFDPEHGYLSFGYMKTTNNMLRYYDSIWNWMVTVIPKLMENLALMKEGDKLRAMKQAVILLVKASALEPLYLEGKRIKPARLQQKGPGGV